ncbi:hypothetical protein OVA24_05080 [Luteolibacter sp. SL250]|uniref:hypothetical protein n=1 Tax=Luteolibacter sp. SL250 TaxID=2995170 RepID=UPI0022717A2A|nr:hypothetical protein [Luteolibacter sp. SL250]WAC20754.1 hypothetical protein OVA24_05080 [Luteolibacter sp. SL250]
MKAISLVSCLLLLQQLPSIAGAPPADQLRLVKLELELGLRRAEGFGDRHPTIRRIETGIQMIEKRTPQIRDEEYRKLLERNRTKLEDERIRLIDGGYGDNHPGRLEIDRQLAEANRRLEKMSGK